MFLVPNREVINTLIGRKTENWLVGWSNGHSIYVLSEKNYEKESNHKYSKKEYCQLIKHELVHCITLHINGNLFKPIWLLDGLAMFLSEQIESKRKPENYSKFLEFHEKKGKEVYSESGFAVEFLLKEYGKEKLIELIRETKKYKAKEEFAELFKKIYGFELNYNNFKIL